MRNSGCYLSCILIPMIPAAKVRIVSFPSKYMLPKDIICLLSSRLLSLPFQNNTCIFFLSVTDFFHKKKSFISIGFLFKDE